MTVVLQEPAIVPPTNPAPSRGGVLWQVLKRRPSAAVGAIIVTLFMALAVAAPWFTPPSLHSEGAVYGRPSTGHWLGLDDTGTDMVQLLIRGARISLIVGVAAMVISMLVGGAVGVLAGYFGGAVDTVLMRLTDYFLVIPYLPLMIVIAAIWGPSLGHIILVIGLLQWTWTARIVRAQVKSASQRLYVKRIRSLGASHRRIVVRHVLPQIAPLIIALAVLSTAYAIFSETALSFLGLGDPATVSWGTIIHRSFERTAISSGAWWVVVPPGLCVALVVIGCSLLGRALEDALNPRLGVTHLSPRRFRYLGITVSDDEAV